MRSIFGASNREVSNPSWMSGAFDFYGILITYNRFWIVLFSLAVFAALLFVLKRTALGLQMRAVTQNRRMASSMGIRTPWVDAMTFGLGSGGGHRGAGWAWRLARSTTSRPISAKATSSTVSWSSCSAASAISGGTLVGALTLGVLNKFLEPYAGAVLAKIAVLVLVILFIQKAPARPVRRSRAGRWKA